MPSCSGSTSKRTHFVAEDSGKSPSDISWNHHYLPQVLSLEFQLERVLEFQLVPVLEFQLERVL